MSDETTDQKSEPTLKKSCGTDAARSRANRRRSAGMAGVAAAIGAAVLSSSCFWLPVLLVAGGASAAGTATAVEALRLPLLGATLVLLAGGFYLLYIRKQEGCSPAQKRMRSISRVALWGGAAIALTFIAFPDQVSRALPGSQAQAASIDENEDGVKAYKLDGMHSPACVGVAERILAEVPGVRSTSIRYEEGEVRLSPQPGTEIDDNDVLSAIEQSPFEATPLR